jgi:Domain of unknown function (DUF1844)
MPDDDRQEDLGPADRDDALFVNLILIFQGAAMQQMGKITTPLTGKIERNIEQARFSIDTLAMLREKTRGNLSGDLERLLDTTLLNLRMNFIEESAKETQAEGKTAEKAEEQAEGKTGDEGGETPGAGAAEARTAGQGKMGSAPDTKGGPGGGGGTGVSGGAAAEAAKQAPREPERRAQKKQGPRAPRPKRGTS